MLNPRCFLCTTAITDQARLTCLPVQLRPGQLQLELCAVELSAVTLHSVIGADPDAAGEYFDYSIDELGLQDIKAADVLIQQIVMKELATK